jgi:hypothetical protein
MSDSITPNPISEFPAVDQRLATPGTRFEIVDGRSVYVAPADEPRGERIAGVGCLLGAHRAAGYLAAIRMLTRTSQIDDLAPDVSVYPTARDPRDRRPPARGAGILGREHRATRLRGHQGRQAGGARGPAGVRPPSGTGARARVVTGAGPVVAARARFVGSSIWRSRCRCRSKRCSNRR